MSSAGFVRAYATRQRPDRGLVDAGDRRDPVEREVGQARPVGVEPVRVRRQKRRVVEVRVDDGAREAEGERGIGARAAAEDARPPRRSVSVLARIDDDQRRAARLRVEDEPPLVDVGLRGVVAPQEDEPALDREPRVVVEVCAVGQARGLEAGRPAQIAVGGRAAAELAPEGHGEAAQRAVRSRTLRSRARLPGRAPRGRGRAARRSR